LRCPPQTSSVTDVDVLRCAHCSDVVGAYEPIYVLLADGTNRRGSSLTLKDQLPGHNCGARQLLARVQLAASAAAVRVRSRPQRGRPAGFWAPSEFRVRAGDGDRVAVIGGALPLRR